SLLAGGAGVLTHRALAGKPTQPKAAASPPVSQEKQEAVQADAKQPRTVAEPAAEWTYEVTYRGRPVAGAKVGLLLYTHPTPGESTPGEPIFATTDDKGEARFPIPADSSSRMARLLARDLTGHGGYGTMFGENQRQPSTLG